MADGERKKKSYIIDEGIRASALIPGYPAGSDLTIINTAYIPRLKNEETGRYEKDYLAITFRDNVKGIKKVHIIYQVV